MTHHFISGEAALWIQRNGPNTEPEYLGCHQLGDVDQPEGDLELIYCPDPSGPNRFRVVGSIQGAPGAITTTVTTDVTDELDELERVRCPFVLYAHMIKAGRRDVFPNFDRSFVFVNARVTSRGLSSLVARNPEDQSRAEQTFDISAEELLRFKEPSLARQSSITETQNITDITFCNDESCRTAERVAQDSCQVGFASTRANTTLSVPASANVLKTTNGSTWTATAADPFAASEHIAGIECFDFGRDTVRVIVARGVTDAGNPAEIAYSDDSGATWTTVNVGSTNGQFVANARGLFALDRNNIWVATNTGFIYKSNDAGATWTAQESGSINSGAWNAVRFVDESVGWIVGALNEIAKTTDGGATWTAVTGPSAQNSANALVVEVLDRNRVWVGYDNGKLYYTTDGGTTWYEKTFPGSASGQVKDVRFYNDVLAYMIHDTSAPLGRVLWSIDGGFTWSALTTDTNAGYNSLYICNENALFVAGNAQGGTGYIAKATI